MRRNSYSHFSTIPAPNIQRSKWPMPQRILTSANVGEVIPFFWSEVLPGDTWQVETSMLTRMQTLKTPMMDDLFLDKYYFYVPLRIIWSHFKEFMGESPKAWMPDVEYTVPQITSPQNGWSVGSVADYLGIPPLVGNLSVSALPFRAYARVIEDWFRDTNLQDAQVIYDGDSDVTGLNPGQGTILTEPARGGAPFVAAKMHDFYTSMLPEPQRGEASTVNLTQGPLPVYTVHADNAYYAPLDGETGKQYYERMLNEYPIHYSTGVPNGPTPTGSNGFAKAVYYPLSDNYYFDPSTAAVAKQSSDITGVDAMQSSNNKSFGYTYIPHSVQGGYDHIDTASVGEMLDVFEGFEVSNMRPYFPTNLVAGNESALITINQLRQAFAIQRFYEASARGGNRYISLLKAFFGTAPQDARLQRAEYLGGNRQRLNIRQIIQTSETTANAPLGDLAGISVTGDKNYDFEKSFTEHGILMGVFVVRYRHTYQQGIEQSFLRKSIFEFYFPQFSHLGEFGYKNALIYATGTDADDEIFGYNEAWADYRFKSNRVSGMMRSVSNSGLDTWHLADYYTQQPYLSSSWIKEDKGNVDRVLTVGSNVSDQIFCDIEVDSYVTRPMPLYSVPGLLDHF